MEIVIKKHGRLHSYSKAVHRTLLGDTPSPYVDLIPKSLDDTQMVIAVAESVKRMIPGLHQVNTLSREGPELRVALFILPETVRPVFHTATPLASVRQS